MIQTYNVSGAVKLDFLNMEEVANFAGTIKFTNGYNEEFYKE